MKKIYVVVLNLTKVFDFYIIFHDFTFIDINNGILRHVQSSLN